MPSAVCVQSFASLLSLCGASAQPCVPHWVASPSAPDFGIHALAAVTDAAGSALYAGGWFTSIGGVSAERIARYGNGVWTPLGSGIPGPFNSHGFMDCCANVHSITADAGIVYVGGNFIFGGGVLLESLGQWDGSQWRDLAGGMTMAPGCFDCAPVVYSLARFGGSLHAAGTFDLAGATLAARVARWNGIGWAPLGAGIGVAPGDTFPAWVYSLTPWAGDLYACGRFSRAGATDTLCVARWDGATWTDVGGGLRVPEGGRHPSIAASVVFDDGHGPALFVAGILDIAGTTNVRNIAKWDGLAWSDVGGGIGSDVNDRVWALAVFDDGMGRALYAAGQFGDAGGAPAANIAKWNGTAWSALDAGVNGDVHALAVFDDGSGPALHVGGWFTSAGGASSPYLAKWVACPAVCYANCDGSSVAPVLNVADFVCFVNKFAAGDAYANCDGSTTPPALNIADFVCFLNSFAAGCP
ncbi:MAG: GC-type dockerin domain-anchored protein [Phycisphaerales bacterium]